MLSAHMPKVDVLVLKRHTHVLRRLAVVNPVLIEAAIDSRNQCISNLIGLFETE